MSGQVQQSLGGTPSMLCLDTEGSESRSSLLFSFPLPMFSQISCLFKNMTLNFLKMGLTSLFRCCSEQGRTTDGKGQLCSCLTLPEAPARGRQREHSSHSCCGAPSRFLCRSDRGGAQEGFGAQAHGTYCFCCL